MVNGEKVLRAQKSKLEDTLVSGKLVFEHLVLHLVQSLADIGTDGIGAIQKCGRLDEAPAPFMYIPLYHVQH